MPELPEVESLVRRLEPLLRGREIQSTSVLWPRSIAKITGLRLKDSKKPDPKHPFSEASAGFCFSEFKRCGKYLHFVMKRGQDQKHLFVHLRMSGSMQVFSVNSSSRKHDRVLFELSGEKQLHFHDPRKFGRMYWVNDPAEVVGNVGIDPFDEAAAEHLCRHFKKLKMRVKPALLRQDIMAGVGNIYADECLWSAKVHPLTPTNKLTEDVISKLVRDLRKILSAAIEASGTDFGDHVVEGSFAPKVYGRTNEPCKRCKTPISRIIVGQRGTHFCQNCQRE